MNLPMNQIKSEFSSVNCSYKKYNQILRKPKREKGNVIS